MEDVIGYALVKPIMKLSYYDKPKVVFKPRKIYSDLNHANGARTRLKDSDEWVIAKLKIGEFLRG